MGLGTGGTAFTVPTGPSGARVPGELRDPSSLALLGSEAPAFSIQFPAATHGLHNNPEQMREDLGTEGQAA